MAAITGGAGVVAAVGSKAHLIKKFQKVGDLLSDFAKATRKLKLEGKKRKAKGNSAKFSDMEADQVQAKKTDAHGAETGETSKPKPYSNPKNRPKYEDGQVEDVWESAKQIDGNVYDPNTGELLEWDAGSSRAGQWDMGHKPGKEYHKLHKDYMDGKISKDEFLTEYRDPQNYQPESPSANRSRRFEE